MIEFTAFPKIARLFRDVVITEKIDGTNAAIGIVNDLTGIDGTSDISGAVAVIGPDAMSTVVRLEGEIYTVYAQSRKRIIAPNSDNFCFARWVWDNAETLVTDLGPGLHFGEWWGSGIQRGYGLPKGEKRFSLFNVKRWTDAEFKTPSLDVVPVLYRGPFSTGLIKLSLANLRNNGSYAAPDFMNPEGIIVYHTAANTMFKVTLENDEQPKSAVLETA